MVQDFQGLSKVGHKLLGSWKVTYCCRLVSWSSCSASIRAGALKLWEHRTLHQPTTQDRNPFPQNSLKV